MIKERIYNKLVRDMIPEIIEKSGNDYKIHIAGEDEYKYELLKKLKEEVNEFILEPCEEEIADILEVLDALIQYYNFASESITEIRNYKSNKRGKFEKRIILEKVMEKFESDIYTYLHWNAPINKQEIAMNELASRNDIDPRSFLQPVDKGYWENAAKVLYKMGYPKIHDAVPGIFAWIQDMAWPGAFVAVQILEFLPKEVFLQNLKNSVKEALKTNDESWIYNMQEFIKHLWVNEKENLPKEIYLILLDDNFSSGMENNYSMFKEI